MSIVHRKATVEEIRTALREAPLTALRDMLPDQKIHDGCRRYGYEHRHRLYSPVVTVFHFLLQAIQREESFAATWQKMWTPLAAAFPELASHSFDSSALAHARSRLPREVLEFLAQDICGSAAEDARASSMWRGFRLSALDGTTVSMPRELELFKHFGAHKARTTTVRYPLATFCSLLAVGTSAILDYRFGPFDPGETKTATPLLSRLGEGDLVLADRGFSGSPTIARILQRGADFLMRKNARLIVERLKPVEALGWNDLIAEIPVDKSARRKDPTLPEVVRVRVFKARWRTPAGERVTEWFVTSLENARRFKKCTLAKLYHERWRIETSYLEFKVMFHSDVLRSKTVDNVYKEFASHVLGYQLVRRLMVAAAARHGKKPTRLSFLNAARWVISFSNEMAKAPAWRLRELYECLLDAIASSEIDVRPGRLEPRALTREWKHYPHLRCTRAEWRRRKLSGAAS